VAISLSKLQRKNEDLSEESAIIFAFFVVWPLSALPGLVATYAQLFSLFFHTIFTRDQSPLSALPGLLDRQQMVLCAENMPAHNAQLFSLF